MNKSVTDILDALAARFGTTAAHLWAVLIRQVYLEAAFNVLIAILFCGAAFAIWPRWRKAVKVDDDERALLFCILFWIVSVLGLIGTIIALGSLLQLANPEYGALVMIFKAVNRR